MKEEKNQMTQCLHAEIFTCLAISFSNAWKWKVKMKSLSRVRLFSTPWTAAHQTPPSMGFSRQEYGSGVPLPSPTLSPSNHKCVSYICDSTSILQTSSFSSFFLDSKENIFNGGISGSISSLYSLIRLYRLLAQVSSPGIDIEKFKWILSLSLGWNF